LQSLSRDAPEKQNTNTKKSAGNPFALKSTTSEIPVENRVGSSLFSALNEIAKSNKPAPTPAPKQGKRKAQATLFGGKANLDNIKKKARKTKKKNDKENEEETNPDGGEQATPVQEENEEESTQVEVNQDAEEVQLEAD
jgi:hypothetical protein